MSNSSIPAWMAGGTWTLVDPGAGAAIDNTLWGVVPLVSATTETRTLPAPSKAGLNLWLNMKTDNGDIVVTVTPAYDEAGSTTLTFSAVGQWAHLVSMRVSTSAWGWRLMGYDGVSGPAIDYGAIVVDSVDINGLADGIILDADADTTLSAPTDDQLDVEVGGADVVTITNPSAGEHAYVKLESPCKFNPRETWEFFEDFNMKVLDETNENWILNAGTDDLALDPAIVIAERGTILCDAGDGDGTAAVDISQIVLAIPVQADSGGLVVEARLSIEDITGCSVNFGLTDTTAREEPFSIATSTITDVAANACCFVFDDGATTKEWFMCGVDGSTQATTNAALGVAPSDNNYQVLRCEIDVDGDGAEFFVDGTSYGSLTLNVVDPTVDLFLTATIVGDGANAVAVGLTIDYLYVGHTR